MTDKKFLLEPVPHEEAMAFIRNKPVVTREVFDQLLPALKARAFTVTGIESANTLQRLRDKIAELPAGGNWDDIKADIIEDISPFLVDPKADAETRAAQEAAADRRANLLLRTHGFEAYQAAAFEVMERQKAVFEFWMYMTVGDEAVRDEHAALDGVILPADSPFWSDHYPPWDWGCRCMVAPMMQEEVDNVENGDAEYGRVLSEAQEQRLERTGELDLGDGHTINVSSPAASGKQNAFSWHPGDLSITLDQLKNRYDPEVWKTFKEFAEKTTLAADGTEADGENAYRSLYEWLSGNHPMDEAAAREFTRDSVIKQTVLHETGKFEKRAIEQSGFRVSAEHENGRMYGNGVYFRTTGKGVKTFGSEKVEAVLNVKNPLEVEHYDLWSRASPLRKKIEQEFPGLDKAEQIAQYCLRHGYDAVIVARKTDTFIMVPDVKNIGIKT